MFSQSAHLIGWRRQAATSVALTSSVIAAVRRHSGKKKAREQKDEQCFYVTGGFHCRKDYSSFLNHIVQHKSRD